MSIELGVLWIFLALLSGAPMSAYVWQRRSDDTHPHSDGGQGLQRAISPLSTWSVDRDDHS
jgi:hypothetical protein